jgi:hypothetical protein
MKTQSNALRAAALATTLLLSGCASTTPSWENNFGASVRSALALQTIDPAAAAAAQANPVIGIDGRAARAAQQRYESSFSTPAEAQGSLTTGSIK